MLTKQEINLFAGKTVHALRLTHGISCATLGKEIGVSGQQVQKYESGMNALSIDRLHTLATVFGVSVVVFFPIENAIQQHEALPPAGVRLLKLINKISEEHHDSLSAILRAVVQIIQNSELSGKQS